MKIEIRYLHMKSWLHPECSAHCHSENQHYGQEHRQRLQNWWVYLFGSWTYIMETTKSLSSQWFHERKDTWTLSIAWNGLKNSKKEIYFHIKQAEIEKGNRSWHSYLNFDLCEMTSKLLKKSSKYCKNNENLIPLSPFWISLVTFFFWQILIHYS